MARRHLLTTLLVVLALVATACSSDEADTTGGVTSVEESSSSETTDESAGSDATTPAGDDTEEPTTTASSNESAEAGGADAEPAQSLYPLTIADATGEEFTFDEPPVLGCVWTGCVEVAAALGMTLRASTVSDAENEWPIYGSGNVDRAVADWTNPESWAAIDVDVILGSVAQAGAPVIEAIETAAPVFFLHYDNFVGEPAPGALGGNESYVENLRLMAQIADDPAAGDDAIARFDALRESLIALSTPETEAQTVSVLFAMDGYAALGPSSAFCQLLAETGHGTCVGEGVGAMLNSEAFLSLDPDVILASNFGGQTTVQFRAENDPIWPLLSAVQNDRVYQTDRFQFSCCSTSAQILSAHEYVALLFPELGIERPDQTTFDPATGPLVVG
ncbi:MAG: ABC transporter substrate-binding protein [Actinomycetota bacterium]